MHQEEFEELAHAVTSSLVSFPEHQIQPFRSEDFRNPLRRGLILDNPSLGSTMRDFSPGADLRPIVPNDKGRSPSEPNSEEEDRIIGKSVRTIGFDALGFYKSFRFQHAHPFPGTWGIFLLRQGVSYLAKEIDDFHHNSKGPAASAQAAMAFLLAHESYHFRVDAWSLQLEAATGMRHYETYRRTVYVPAFPHPVVVEEALANNLAFAEARQQDIAGFARWFMKCQPGAYRNFEERMNARHAGAKIHRALLCAQIAFPCDPVYATPNRGMPFEPWMRGISRPKTPIETAGDGCCPRWEVHGADLSCLLPAAVSGPPHDEMRKFVLKYLRGRACRRTGHDMYVLDNGELIRFPNAHGEDRLRGYEFDGILRSAGMRYAEFRAERARTRSWRRDVPRPTPRPALPR